MQKQKDRSHMKKRRTKNLGVTIIAGMFLICVFLLLLDLVYHDYFYCDFLWACVCRVEGWFTGIGFEEDRAAGILSGGLGLAITMVTFGLTMGVNLFNRYERKVYGILYGELYTYNTLTRNISYIISWALPICIVVTINLKLYAVSYLLLFYSYIIVLYNYGIYGRSHDKKRLRSDVADCLIACVEEEDLTDARLTDYDAKIDDMRQGIWETEGWNDAWLLLTDVIEKIMHFENERLYILACHLWDIFFTEKTIGKSFIFVRKYIREMGDSGRKYEKELIVFWSLMSSVALRWEAETLKSFLEWFADPANRRGQRVLTKEAGMVLLMLEYWLYVREDELKVKRECADKIYEYGRKIFLEEEYIQFLTELYQKQYEAETWSPDRAARIFYIDIKWNLKNSLFRTEFNL